MSYRIGGDGTLTPSGGGKGCGCLVVIIIIIVIAVAILIFSESIRTVVVDWFLSLLKTIKDFLGQYSSNG